MLFNTEEGLFFEISSLLEICFIYSVKMLFTIFTILAGTAFTVSLVLLKTAIMLPFIVLRAILGV